MTPDLITQLFDEILACACQALDDFTECGCPCRKYISAGRPVWDNCCPDGQLTVNLDRLYAHGNFPGTAAGPLFCQAPLAAEFTVALVRCHPTVDDNGDPPSGPTLDAAANQVHTDLYVLLNALICCLSAKSRTQNFVLLNSGNILVNGGCVGFEIRFGIQLVDPLP